MLSPQTFLRHRVPLQCLLRGYWNRINVHQLHTGGISSDHRNIFHGNTDHNAFIGNHHDVMIIVYQLCSLRYHRSSGDLIAENTLTTTVLGRKLLNRVRLPMPFLRYNQSFSPWVSICTPTTLITHHLTSCQSHPWIHGRSHVHRFHGTGCTGPSSLPGRYLWCYPLSLPRSAHHFPSGQWPAVHSYGRSSYSFTGVFLTMPPRVAINR